MQTEHKRRNLALLVLGTGIVMFVLMLVFVLPYFMSEKKYGEMQAALNEGDYYKVFKISEFLLSQDPTSLQAYYFRGQAYLALKKYNQAEQDLEQVIDLNAQYSNMRNVSVQLGEIYHKHGLALLTHEPDKSYRLFLKALKYLPRDNSLKKDLSAASYYVGLAVENKDKNKAVKFYREAVKYNPDKALYKVSLARSLFATSKIEEAVALLDQALEKDTTLKTPVNLELFQNALWRLALTKERDYFEGKINNVQLATSRLDQILELDTVSKNAILERFALAINLKDKDIAEKILTDVISKGLLLPTSEMDMLVNTSWETQPKMIFTGGNDTDVEVKLDSELAWSSDGTKIVAKAMDKSTSQTKLLVYKLSDGSVNIVQDKNNISWEGKIFTPDADGLIVSSENTLFRLTDNLTLKKIFEMEEPSLDITRDGKEALAAKGRQLYRYTFENNDINSVSSRRTNGEVLNAVFSPQNKRIAVLSGDENDLTLSVILNRYRSKVLAEGKLTEVKWAWEGNKLYFINNPNNINSLYAVNVTNGDDVVAVTKPEHNVTLYEPSPIDDYLIYRATAGKELLILSDEKGNLKPVVPRFGQFGKIVWSPDGTKVAYLFSPVQGGPVRLEIMDVNRF